MRIALPHAQGCALGWLAMALVLGIGCPPDDASRSAPDGHAAPAAEPAPTEETPMPKRIELRRDQPGVVGVDSRVLTIEGGMIKRRKLLNERLVKESERELSEAELALIAEALEPQKLERLGAHPPPSRGAKANEGRLILQADGTRVEGRSLPGAPAEGAAASHEAELEDLAELLESLAD